jgi:hypothetical protein
VARGEAGGWNAAGSAARAGKDHSRAVKPAASAEALRKSRRENGILMGWVGRMKYETAPVTPQLS